LEARLAVMEQRLASMAAENQVLREQVKRDGDALEGLNARLAAPTSADAQRASAVTFAGKENRFAVGGLAQVFGEAGGTPDARFAGIGDRFQLRRLRINLAGAFAQDVAFKIETDFGNASIAANSGSRGQLTDAFVSWNRFPAWRMQAGQFKTPFGYDQLVADANTLFVERSLPNDRLTVGRQVGAMVCGNLFGKALGYSFGVFNGTGVNTAANDNSKFMQAGRLTGVLLAPGAARGGLRWTAGTNFFNTVDRGSFSGRRTGLGFDTQVSGRLGEAGFEWLRNDLHPVTGRAAAAEGWSSYGAWRLAERWQAVLRFDSFDANGSQPGAVTREWTVGTTYFLLGDDLKFTVNYLLGDQAGARDGRLIGRVQVVF
jgi:phosphate-selective porin